MDWEAWRAVIHGVAKSRARLSDWTELNKCEDISETLSYCRVERYDKIISFNNDSINLLFVLLSENKEINHKLMYI